MDSVRKGLTSNPDVMCNKMTTISDIPVYGITVGQFSVVYHKTKPFVIGSGMIR